MQSQSPFLNVFTVDLLFDALIIRLLDLPNYGSDSWRRHTLKGVC